jgi:hypothetical protein
MTKKKVSRLLNGKDEMTVRMLAHMFYELGYRVSFQKHTL